MEKAEILVVEDENKILDAIANEFQSKGVRVLTAHDDEEGLRLFYQRASSISAVVTDMRLRSKRRDDHTGGEFARRLKSINPGLPIFCNSAIDVRAKFPMFDRYFIKGRFGRDDFFENIPEMIDKAVEYENSRFASVPASLVRLKEKYQISDADFFDLVGSRRLVELQRTAMLLFHHAVEEAAEPTTALQISAVTASTNLAEIEVIEPGMPVTSTIPLKHAVPVVIELIHDVWLAELFGFPLIYTYADTKDEAIAYLLKFLWECHRAPDTLPRVCTPDKEPKTEINVPMDVIRFGTFLRFLFE